MVNEIPQITIREIPAPEPPVIRPVQFPRPVLNMPGCVAVHPDAGLNPSLLVDDPKRVGYYCPDGELPSFGPIEYNPSDLTILGPQGDIQQQEQESSAPQTPRLPVIPELQGQQDLLPRAESTIVQQIVEGLPEVPAVVTTASIALVATTSALMAKPLADLLLKLIKPAIKKTVAKIRALQGHEPRLLSVFERRQEQRDRNQAVKALRRSLGR